MEKSHPHLFGLLAGLFLAAGLALSAIIFTRTWLRISESEIISVTGSARKNIRSDLVIWRGGFSVDAPTLLEAQQALHDALAKVQTFLATKNIKDATLLPVQIREITARSEQDNESVTKRIGYRLSQSIEVRSSDVDGVPRLGSESNELLQQGVAFVAESPTFIYTKAGEAKVEMMAEATKDARARAEQIATQGGRGIKQLREARMGVVQINPLYSSSTSWEGNNDATSLEKTITATVSASFSLK